MTTIITKHGNGVPTGLQVGELAVDKSEPALYTNTGTKIEKIGGGGGGGGPAYLEPYPQPSVSGWEKGGFYYVFKDNAGGTFNNKAFTVPAGKVFFLMSITRSGTSHTVKNVRVDSHQITPTTAFSVLSDLNDLKHPSFSLTPPMIVRNNITMDISLGSSTPREIRIYGLFQSA